MYVDVNVHVDASAVCVHDNLFVGAYLFFSAGVGRTGTFIAVDAMMQRLKEKDDLNVYNFVTQMRTKQAFMVQNLVCM